MSTKEKINLLLVLGAILVLLMIGVSKESFPYQITKKETEPEPEKKSKPVEVYEPELLTPMFYLVAGSFANEENAELFANEMRELGFEPYLLPETDGYYRVGIFSSPYKEDVLSYKENSVDPSMKMWITYQ
jgi:hypothetical protein